MKPADVVVDSHPVKKVLQPVAIDGWIYGTHKRTWLEEHEEDAENEASWCGGTFTSCQKSAAASQPEEDQKSSPVVCKKLGVISSAAAALVKKTGKPPTNNVMNMPINQ